MRINRTPDEWRQLFALQQESGLSKSRFCRQHNITRSAFSNAKKRLTGEALPDDISSCPFIPVSPSSVDYQLISVPAESSAETDASVSLPAEPVRMTIAQCSLQFPASLSPAWLAALLRELTS
ncbi:TPA: hypothetical protein RU600_001878 [Salmonella enterica]|nr:hypothetical protein [Salmonella enterica]HEA0390766.1 hypothetical protein [Salmonella enterica]